ncbi:glycosyl transferase family 2 [Pseudomonas sp. HMWF031]|nr:glycosyl transferase family 2 [Pseudomonas sp. HMWF031]
MKSPSTLEVAILLCTYNGHAFLKEQIDSFIAQTHQKWTLYISDDGSTDGTLALLENYQDLIDTKRIQVFTGPRAGFAENFMSLVRNQSIKADFFAFSDQDDIWFNNKLERSIRQLESLPAQRPALYCSRTRLIDENRKIIGFSPEFKRAPTFQNALIQSLAGANTMLLNGAARDLLNKIPQSMTIVAHDWFTYLLTTACGGTVIYDCEPTLDYRQHGGNVIGANSSLKERVIRLGKLIDGRFRRWSDSNLQILELLEEQLTPVNRQTLNDFKQGRQSSFFRRFRLMKKSGVYRQTRVGNISLILAICLNKI